MPLFGILAEVTTDPSAVVDSIKQVVDSATTNFSMSTIASILGVAIAGSAGLFLLWWGSWKGIRMLKNAFTKGKLSI